MKLLKTLFDYIETIVNILSNALVQTFLVYTTVVLIYKFFIEEQTTNYIPTFITEILTKIRKTYYEMDYTVHQYGLSNRQEIVDNYNKLSIEEKIIHKQNNEHNKNVINNALKLSVLILVVFILFTIITNRMAIHIHWYQLLLSSAITVIGTLYEYFFITQIIVKYNFIELTKIYDVVADKMNQISDKVVKDKLVKKLEESSKNKLDYNKPDNINANQLDNNMNFSIDDLVKNKGTLQNALRYSETDNLLQKIGNTLNDIEHNELKNSL